jgi:hypothetical protein
MRVPCGHYSLSMKPCSQRPGLDSGSATHCQWPAVGCASALPTPLSFRTFAACPFPARPQGFRCWSSKVAIDHTGEQVQCFCTVPSVSIHADADYRTSSILATGRCGPFGCEDLPATPFNRHPRRTHATNRHSLLVWTVTRFARVFVPVSRPAARTLGSAPAGSQN